jgi:ribosomal 50S subunit-recycling heat shock protein
MNDALKVRLQTARRARADRTRSLRPESIRQGKVHINGSPARASREPCSVGDRISLRRPGHTRWN